MSLQRLATVELQLIMQCCDAQSLLALARCSRFTFAAASNPFAWRRALTVEVDIARFVMAEPTSSLQCLWGSICCAPFCPASQSRPQPAVPLPPVVADPRWSLLRHVDQLVRWTSAPGVRSADHHRAGVARRLLPLLPRVRSLDLSDSRLLGIRWADVEQSLTGLGGLTALDIVGTTVRDDGMRVLARLLPLLRTLRCHPSGDARQCLQPLTELPLLTNLGLVAASLRGPPGDFAVIAERRGLRHLALRSAPESLCGPVLLAPGLRQLRRLTLAHVFSRPAEARADWTAVCANLLSLRRLTLDRCDHRCSAPLVAAATGPAGLPQLRRLRVAPAVINHSNSWTAVVDPRFYASLRVGAISALLERRPEVRVELRVGFGMAGVSASWLLPLRAECDWQSAVPQWTDFELLHPKRSRSRYSPLLFVDDELGREATEEEGEQ